MLPLSLELPLANDKTYHVVYNKLSRYGKYLHHNRRRFLKTQPSVPTFIRTIQQAPFLLCVFLTSTILQNHLKVNENQNCLFLLSFIKFALPGDVVQWQSVQVACTKPGALSSAGKNKIAKILSSSKVYCPSIFLQS